MSNKKDEESIKTLALKSIRELEILLKQKPNENLLKACQLDSRIGVQRLAERYHKQQQAQAGEDLRIKKLLIEEEKLWKQGYLLIAGIDEAGRGPLAGPVVAAACILPAKFDLPGLNDSKKLSAIKRERLFEEIKKQSLDFGVGSAEPAEIDVLNILQATKLAMKRAVESMRTRPHYLLIDALELPMLHIPQQGIIGGDALSASIAAASILAKVTRDHWMNELHTLYPEYGFERNKGYGTEEHMQVLRRLGPSPIHRRSFAPVNREGIEMWEFM